MDFALLLPIKTLTKGNKKFPISQGGNNMKILYALLGAPGVGKTTFISNMSEEIYGDDTSQEILYP